MEPSDGANVRDAPLRRVCLREPFRVFAVIAPALLYVSFVWHFAVSAPLGDDWSRVPLTAASLHGNLTFSAVWIQWSEARLVLLNLAFAVFGHINHLDTKSLVMFSALIYVAAYFLLIAAFRLYVRRPLTAPSVLLLGVVWFSLVNATNALWAFQLAWYLVLIFLLVMIHLLFLPTPKRSLALTLAIACALGGSLSMLQGFLLWPIGLICLLWTRTTEPTRTRAVFVWLIAGLATTLVYFRGYRFSVRCPGSAKACSVSANASHPGRLASYYLTLVGRALVLPWGGASYRQIPAGLLLAAAVFVMVRTIQERTRVGLPLPLLMITFALLFDLTIALGRAGLRPTAGGQDRYAMPSVILLVGVVAYVWAHPPRWRTPSAITAWRHYSLVVAFVVFAMLVLAQTVTSTEFGIHKARTLRAQAVSAARTVVNLDRISRVERGCYVSTYVWNGAYGPPQALAVLRLPRLRAKRDHLTVFAGGTFRKYRAEGPPPRPPCRNGYFRVPIPEHPSGKVAAQ